MKIGIIGAGAVGTACIMAILGRGAAHEIVVLDSNEARVRGVVTDMQYGTPLSAALRMLAQELRQETLTRFEERAARLPVMLTMPMILFILPCVFLVVGGPAIIKVMHVMQ